MRGKKQPYRILLYDEGAKGPTQLRGAQLARLELMERLDPRLFQPLLLTSKEGDLALEARRRGLFVVVEDIIGDMNRETYSRTFPIYIIVKNHAYTILRAVFRLTRFLRRYEVDLVHPNDNLSRVIAGIAGKMERIPIVTTISDELNQHPSDIFLRLFYLTFFDRIIAVSDAMRNLFAVGRYVPGKITTIYPGINLSLFSRDIPTKARKEFGISESERVIGTLGTLEGDKGHPVLLRALSRVKKEGIPCKLLVVGNGPEGGNLRKLVQKLTLEEDVIFTGFRRDIPPVIQAMDIIVNCSDSEAFPRVVLEAMAMAKPVIATDVGGTSEAVVDGLSAYLIPRGNDYQLYRALKTLLEDVELRGKMGRYGLECVLSSFSVDAGVRNVARLYLELLQEDRQKPASNQRAPRNSG